MAIYKAQELRFNTTFTMRYDLLSAMAWTFVLSVLSLLCFRFAHRINRTRAVPLRWPVLGMIPGLLANAHVLHDYVTCLLRATKGTFMFRGPWLMGMDFLITCDPANANHMYNANFSNYPKGHDFSEIFDILGSGIFSADGELWSRQRKTAHAFMTSQQFRSSVAKRTRDKVADSLVPVVDEMIRLNRVIDLHDLFKRFTMDVTCKLVLGTDTGCVATDFPDVPFAMAVDDSEEVLFLRHLSPKLWWKLLRWLNVGEEKKMSMATVVIDRFIARCIAEKRGRLEVEEATDDLLTCYMRAFLEESEKDDYFGTDKFLRDTLLTLLGAGKDTTGSGLSWFFWLLSKHPNVEKNILEELRTIRSEANKVDVVVFDAETIKGLVYLHAAICESLRLYPPVPVNHKMALEEDVLPSGHRVGAGTMIHFNAYSTARMEAVWGPDCSEFKPERWIDSRTGEAKRAKSNEFLAFHSGPRSCLGKDMALTQMKVVAATLVYNYRAEAVEGHVVEPKVSIVLQMKKGFMVKMTKREAT